MYVYVEGPSAFSTCGTLKVKNSSLEMLTGVCGASFVIGVKGLSPVSDLTGTSRDGRELELWPESWRYGLSANFFMSTDDGALARLSGREKLKDGRGRPVTLLIDLSEAIEGDRGIIANGDSGARGMLNESTELLREKLSTSSEFPSIRDRIPGDPPLITGEGAARFGFVRLRNGNEKDGVGELRGIGSGSVGAYDKGLTDGASKASGECVRGNG